MQHDPLKEELKEKKILSTTRCLEIITPICDVLAKAHSLGIVHRDIKPENIFLHQGEEGEIVKVLDFGIAKLVENSSSLHIKNLTATGALIGTPAYMSPERFEEKPYDGKSDIYSIGIMLYEMLCGQVPFLAGDAGFLGVMVQHIVKSAPPMKDFNPSINREIELVVTRCIEKDPNKRPTADELLAIFTEAIKANNK